MEIFGNLFLATLLALRGNLCEPCLGTLLGNPLLGTFVNGTLAILVWEPSWEPLLGKLWLWEPLPEPCLGTLPANLLLGTFLLETSSWEPLRTLLGSLAWEPLLGIWEPCAVGFWLLRPAPGTLLWLKTLSLRCWGKKTAMPLSYHPSFGIVRFSASDCLERHFGRRLPRRREFSAGRELSESGGRGVGSARKWMDFSIGVHTIYPKYSQVM